MRKSRISSADQLSYLWRAIVSRLNRPGENPATGRCKSQLAECVTLEPMHER